MSTPKQHKTWITELRSSFLGGKIEVYVMPQVTYANTCAPTSMFGSKGAEIIRSEVA